MWDFGSTRGFLFRGERMNIKAIVKWFCGILGGIIIGLLVYWLTIGPPHFIKSTESEKELLNVSPNELIEWHRKINHEVQAKIIAKQQYYGKSVKWEGTIKNIETWHSSKALIRFQNFSAECDSDVALILNKDMEVFVFGKIRDVHDHGVLLVDCKIERIR